MYNKHCFREFPYVFGLGNQTDQPKISATEKLTYQTYWGNVNALALWMMYGCWPPPKLSGFTLVV